MCRAAISLRPSSCASQAAERMSTNELEALIERHRDVGEDPLEVEKDPERSSPRGLEAMASSLRRTHRLPAIGPESDLIAAGSEITRWTLKA